MNFEAIAPFPQATDESPYLVNVIVETPRGMRHKYAFDPQAGLFALRSTIAEGLAWPYDYGFIPGTLGDDGDCLDVLFLCDEPTFPGCLAQARLLGIIRLQKNGDQNDRLLACAKRVEGIAQSTDAYDDLDDVPAPVIESLRRFLVEYSEGAGHTIVYKGVEGKKPALEAVRTGAKRYDDDKRDSARGDR